MTSGSEPPLYPARAPSAVSGASFGDFGARPPASEPLCSANLCPSACASPAFDPVAARPSGSCFYCTDPSCPPAPAPDTWWILPSASPGSRGSWTLRRGCSLTGGCSTPRTHWEVPVRSSRTSRRWSEPERRNDVVSTFECCFKCLGPVLASNLWLSSNRVV